jgi:hypothetical protein
MQYPPDDPSAARAAAAAALLAALRDVRDANERLQFAAAFVPPPVARSERLTDDLTMLADLDPKLREPLTGPDSVTGDESTCVCGHPVADHNPHTGGCATPGCLCGVAR